MVTEPSVQWKGLPGGGEGDGRTTELQLHHTEHAGPAGSHGLLFFQAQASHPTEPYFSGHPDH